MEQGRTLIDGAREGINRWNRANSEIESNTPLISAVKRVV